MSKPTTFAKALRAEMDERAWTQEIAARELKVAPKTIRNWFNGEAPRLDRYIECCRVFGWPLPYPARSYSGTRMNRNEESLVA